MGLGDQRPDSFEAAKNPVERPNLKSYILVLFALTLSACADRPAASPERQAEVAARGARVMPFDLDRTRHRFEDLPDGGQQTVTVLDPVDSLNLRLIREHLALETAKFSRGEFDDPMAIHGHSMPGLAELRGAGNRIVVEYTPQNEGGRIRYVTAEPALVDALHRWFAAQRSEHGDHAR